MNPTNHRNEKDVVATLTELLLKTRIGVVGRSLGQNLDGFLEVGDVSFITGLLEQGPSFTLRLLSDMSSIDHFGILALQGSMTCGNQSAGYVE